MSFRSNEPGLCWQAWEDIGAERRQFGVTVWATGAEAYIGRRLFRVRWWNR